MGLLVDKLVNLLLDMLADLLVDLLMISLVDLYRLEPDPHSALHNGFSNVHTSP